MASAAVLQTQLCDRVNAAERGTRKMRREFVIAAESGTHGVNVTQQHRILIADGPPKSQP